MKKRLALVSAAIALVGATSAAPGLATPPDDGEHKVTICHVTGSERNPWVIITVDVAAWDGEGANDHTHHTKNGRSDHELVGDTCGDTGGGTTGGGDDDVGG